MTGETECLKNKLMREGGWQMDLMTGETECLKKGNEGGRMVDGFDDRRD